MAIILDACALIAFFRGETGSDVVENYLLDDAQDCLIHSVNLCEVYYDSLRTLGEPAARDIIEYVKNIGITIRPDMDDEFWQMAGQYKGTYRRISLADCFALALVNRLKGSLVTSDRGEFEPIASLGICQIIFIR